MAFARCAERADRSGLNVTKKADWKWGWIFATCAVKIYIAEGILALYDQLV
jgi:hypothetical protein